MLESTYESPWATDETRAFRATVRRFLETELVPVQARWRRQQSPDPSAFERAGEMGLLLPDIPSEYGGGGGTFAHEAVVLEELARSGVHLGASVQNIVAHYIATYGTGSQRQRWLPPLARGQLIGAIAMTEPCAGSDLQHIRTVARRDGDHFVIDGSKTFINNGRSAGLVCLAAKTDPQAPGPRGMSLLCIETNNLAGYRVGQPLEKVGNNGQETCELFFDGARVPASHLLGTAEGKGFFQLMDQLVYERLSVAVSAVATTEEALRTTTEYAKTRTIAGKPLMDLQNTRMVLARCATEARVGRLFLDDCVQRLIRRELDGVTAAMAKYWLTECECRVVDDCVQLHGGYGYMTEYPIARMWVDSRAQRIYAGANEVMKEMIAWAL